MHGSRGRAWRASSVLAALLATSRGRRIAIALAAAVHLFGALAANVWFFGASMFLEVYFLTIPARPPSPFTSLEAGRDPLGSPPGSR